jgi:hypothetical protein
VSSSLLLAKRLRALDDTALGALVDARVASSASIRDFFDLADALLATEGLTAAFTRFPRGALEEAADATLASASPELTALVADHLLGPAAGPEADPSATDLLYPEALSFVRALRLPEPVEQAPCQSEGADTTARGIEQSLAAISAFDEVSRLLCEAPFKELARGGLSAADNARLAPLMPSPEVSPAMILDLGRLAGLCARGAGLWMPTEALTDWLALSVLERWAWLERAWLEQLSESVAGLLTATNDWNEPLARLLDNTYPLGHQWLDADLASMVTGAEILGLSVQHRPTGVGNLVLSGNLAAACELVATMVPPTVDHVFVQHDFTVVAPGPLPAEADVFIRTLCEVESRGLASTFRLSATGVNELLLGGASSQEIVDRLRALSASELPQAVVYLITDLGERFGAIRVRAGSGVTTITSTDALLLDSLTADHSLTTLGSVRPGSNAVLCGHPAATVANALTHARYPAVLEDAEGNVVRAERVAHRVVPRSEPEPPHAALIARLRASREESGTDAATWIARQLDMAVREKTILVVTVRMPDGADRDFVIEPRGFSNGRLRSLDRTTEVERTLPVSHISAVRRAD